MGPLSGFQAFADRKPAEAPQFQRLATHDHVIVVGAGLAGLYTALKLAPMRVTVLSPAPLGEGASSVWAQGGIAAALGEGDTPEAHAADTIAVGGGLVEPRMAGFVAREAAGRIQDLLALGVPFDRDLEGRLRLSQEAAHSARRIVRVDGDRAGAAVMAALIAAARKAPHIRVLEGIEALDLMTASGRIAGVYALSADGTALAIPGRAVVLATGGVGALYARSTNPSHARGTGLAMAARAGAVLADCEFVQFHPTAIAADLDPAPLASEAIRGEGAHLINNRGERFMLKVHDLAELAPRDVVARAVHWEVQSGRGAYLDCRDAIGTRFAQMFPTVNAKCREAGIDPAFEPIPVAPAAHYHMGGVVSDARGRSTLDGLWVCGEVAATGLHGANRLASNSLIEAVVFGAAIAEDIRGLSGVTASSETETRAPALSLAPAPISALATLRATMARHVGVTRNRDGLMDALQVLGGLAAAHPSTRLENSILAARLITTAALARAETRGAQFRSDYPQADPLLSIRNPLRVTHGAIVALRTPFARHMVEAPAHALAS